MSDNPTALFLEALERDLKPLAKAIAELDGLWGKGIGNGQVDGKVLDQLRRRSNGLKIQKGALERLAAGEVPQ
ncbi:MAG TPA: hypothetical protein VFK14_00295 [Solirubrobacterales bacterium]|nr:hypothetical protein [Solirubrobacterales bacterium]